jgi:hypothetical protein
MVLCVVVYMCLDPARQFICKGPACWCIYVAMFFM